MIHAHRTCEASSRRARRCTAQLLGIARRSTGRGFTTFCVVLLISLCALQTGCVRRRLTIRSNPPGALAFVDDREIGVTPVSTEFTYYGTRKIQLFKDGYETVTAKQRFSIPWYELPLLDFVAENLWPHEVRDERAVDFELAPQQIIPNEKLLERAQALRGGSRQGHVTPLWNAPTADPPTVLPSETPSRVLRWPSGGDAPGPEPELLPPLPQR